MNEKQQTLVKSFVKQHELFELVKADILAFGTIKTEGVSDVEIGARYRVREQELERIRKIFQKYELLS